MPEKKKRGRGRPKIEVDLTDVKDLAAEGNSARAIAGVLGIAQSTLFARKDVREAYDEGRAELETNLRHWQIQSCKSGNVQMLIHMESILTGLNGAVTGTNTAAVKILNQKLTDPQMIKICQQAGIDTANKPTIKDFLIATVIIRAMEQKALISAPRFFELIGDLGLYGAKTKEELIEELERSQLRLAESDSRMSVWLGKQYLNQSENGSAEKTDNLTIIDDIPDSEPTKDKKEPNG